MNKQSQSSNRKIKYFIISLFSFSFIFFFQNCSKMSTQTDLSSVAGLTDQQIAEQKASYVLTAKCSSCHNKDVKSGRVDVLNVNEMLSSGAIVPGEPALSPLFQAIQSGRMPPSGGLTQSDVQAIYDWIQKGFDASTPVINLPPPTDTTLKPMYASIYKNILSTKCLGCHNSTNSSGGVSFSTYMSTMNTVQKTLPNNSALYTSVAVRKTMPRGGAQLTPSETQAISDWITAGAMNN